MVRGKFSSPRSKMPMPVGKAKLEAHASSWHNSQVVTSTVMAIPFQEKGSSITFRFVQQDFFVRPEPEPSCFRENNTVRSITIYDWPRSCATEAGELQGHKRK